MSFFFTLPKLLAVATSFAAMSTRVTVTAGIKLTLCCDPRYPGAEIYAATWRKFWCSLDPDSGVFTNMVAAYNEALRVVAGIAVEVDQDHGDRRNWCCDDRKERIGVAAGYRGIWEEALRENFTLVDMQG